MNLLVSDASFAKIRLVLSEEVDSTDVQFKQHPNISKFDPGEPKVISMKDLARGFLVGQSLTVLRWRLKGNNERWTPLSSKYFVTIFRNESN
jgi:coatomer subunit delta